MTTLKLLLYLLSASWILAIFVTLGLAVTSDREKMQRIGFDRFKTMYAISPGKWALGDMGVSYLLPDNDWYSYKDFAFSIPDLVRYRIFLRKIRKKKKAEAEAKDMEIIIRSWQDDIDEYKRKSKRELIDAVNRAQAAKSGMTLDGAIDHARETADRLGCTECGREHAQLAEWLEELKARRADERQEQSVA